MDRSYLLLLVFMACLIAKGFSLPPPCQSEIYCYGPLLHAVQTAEIYRDSKTFVDKKLRYDPKIVLDSFDRLMNLTQNQPSQEQLAFFINQNFESEGSEFETWDPVDWTKDPAFLDNITDPILRDWGSKLHDEWKQLGRQIKDDVKNRPELYSMIYVPHPFIVPGGRFREFYYWDSYWIVQGLLISHMNQTVKGMLDNFLQMVDTYGLVPNGGRIYYEQRSQPPMLIPMVDRYVQATGDVDFLRSRIHLLEKEFQFWMTNRTVNVRGYTLARFNVEFDGPRPESYREDVKSAGSLTGSALEEFYINIKSGAESGWDFSTRWFISDVDGSNEGNLGQIKARDILPVDLNAFICMNARLLSEMYSKTGDQTKSQLYWSIFLQWKEAIKQILWNEEQGIWQDYDILNRIQRPYFYGSNMAPLWSGCWDPLTLQNTSVVDKVITYLEKSNATKFVGGIPTSLMNSGQQWDYPNGWPPLQHLMVVGLENTKDPRAKAMAFDLASKWLNNNRLAYEQSDGAMFEKYDVTVVGLPGGGGEYDVQLGFGWTNGVVLDFLNTYGRRLTVKN